MTQRHRVRALAAAALAEGWPSGWFDQIYVEAAADPSQVPWADLAPNPSLVQWAGSRELDGSGERALKVGCGLGDDAEFLAGLGFEVCAFDISQTAIGWCRRRFPDSRVRYEVGDLLALPEAWSGAFDLVLEAYTLQVLPEAVRAQALGGLPGLLAPGGELLIVARGRDPEDDPGQLPWPLTRAELDGALVGPLQRASFEDYMDGEDPPVRRFRAVYRSGA